MSKALESEDCDVFDVAETGIKAMGTPGAWDAGDLSAEVPANLMQNPEPADDIDSLRFSASDTLKESETKLKELADLMEAPRRSSGLDKFVVPMLWEYMEGMILSTEASRALGRALAATLPMSFREPYRDLQSLI